MRVLGRYLSATVAAYGALPDAKLTDVLNPDKATEFSVPAFNIIAIIDLNAAK